MEQRLHIIALRTVKYSDRNSILSAYSLEMGRVSFIVPAGAGREATRRRALLQPFTPVECIAVGKPGKELMTMREPTLMRQVHTIHSSPARTASAMFACELLNGLLRDNQEDRPLFMFLCEAIDRLNDASWPHTIFPIYFMCCLCRYLGIAPDAGQWRPGSIFDMLEGIFRMSQPLHHHFLNVEESAAVGRLGRLNSRNARFFRFTPDQRRRAIDLILEYYSLHYPGTNSIKSIEVFRSMI